MTKETVRYSDDITERVEDLTSEEIKKSDIYRFATEDLLTRLDPGYEPSPEYFELEESLNPEVCGDGTDYLRTLYEIGNAEHVSDEVKVESMNAILEKRISELNGILEEE